jgi:hypothetical protein
MTMEKDGSMGFVKALKRSIVKAETTLSF